MDTAPSLLDRAAGVLLGQACGDALGVPYEFAPPLTGDGLWLHALFDGEVDTTAAGGLLLDLVARNSRGSSR